MLRNASLSAALTALALLAGRAAAHDYWFEADPAGNGLILLRGHLVSQHEGNELEPYDPAIVQSTACVNSGGAPAEIAFVAVYPLSLPSTCAALFVVVDSGFWTMTSDGSIHSQSQDHSAPQDSWKSLETIKLIARWHERLAGAVSAELELVPTENPFVLEEGDKIRLLVTLAGEPVAGAAVTYDGDLRGLTDADGRINIRIRHGGRQIIAASFDEAYPGAEAALLIRTTTLAFELP